MRDELDREALRQRPTPLELLGVANVIGLEPECGRARWRGRNELSAGAEQNEQESESLEHDLTNGCAQASFRGMAQAHYYGDENLTESERELFELADTEPCAPNSEADSFEAQLRELLSERA